MDSSQASQQARPLQMGAKGAYIVRLLMVGDSACGKTSLVLRFDQNVFSTKFVTTIGVDYRDKMVKVCSYSGLRLFHMCSVGFYFSSRYPPFRSKTLQCAYSFGIRLDRNDFVV